MMTWGIVWFACRFSHLQNWCTAFWPIARFCMICMLSANEIGILWGKMNGKLLEKANSQTSVQGKLANSERTMEVATCLGSWVMAQGCCFLLSSLWEKNSCTVPSFCFGRRTLHCFIPGPRVVRKRPRRVFSAWDSECWRPAEERGDKGRGGGLAGPSTWKGHWPKFWREPNVSETCVSSSS